MTDAEVAEVAKYVRDVSERAQKTVQGWSDSKKAESEREDARFREIGDVARNQR